MAELHVAATVAARRFGVEFDVAAGEVLAVLGPNGAGKSTALHVIAGLLRPDTGVVRVGGRTLTDTAAGIQVATHDRRVGLLLQDPLLFPHLSVQANVEFAPAQSGRGPRAGQGGRRALAGGGGHARIWPAASPGQLSGGQAQRVAIARALAAEPEVLLLDEPLAGLDVAVAASVRAVLRQVSAAAGRATVLITHDLLDVLTLADRVMVVEAGGVAEIGPVAEVLAAPRSQFGARIAGVNVVRGTLDGPHVLRGADGTAWHGTPAEDLTRRARGGGGVLARRGGGLPGPARRQPAQLREGGRRRTADHGSDGSGSRRRAGRRRAGARRRHHRRGGGRPAAGGGGSGVVHGQGPGGRPAPRGATRCGVAVRTALRRVAPSLGLRWEVPLVPAAELAFC